MKRFKIAAFVVGLLVLSMSLVSVASAGPISPPSEGCTNFSSTPTAILTGFEYGSQYFYDHDTLNLSTNVRVNIEVSNPDGFDHTYSNKTSLHLTLNHTDNYTISVAEVHNTPFHLTASCTPTPISGGCIVSNNSFQSSGIITLGLDYNAREYLHVTSSVPVNLSIAGLASAAFNDVTNQGYIFTATGSYVVTINPTAYGNYSGQVSCTLARIIYHRIS